MDNDIDKLFEDALLYNDNSFMDPPCDSELMFLLKQMAVLNSRIS